MVSLQQMELLIKIQLVWECIDQHRLSKDKMSRLKNLGVESWIVMGSGNSNLPLHVVKRIFRFIP